MAEAKASLLIVDSERSTRTSLSHILAENGYRVRSAADGISALDAIRHEVPEVLLSDLNLPGMSGIELLIVVRRRFPTVQVIAMSGAIPRDNTLSDVAADAFYQKSRDVSSLLKIVESTPRQKRTAPKPPALPPPIWVSKNERGNSGEAFATIECPECLRTFPQALEGAMGQIGKTECVVCGSLIRYAII